MSNKRIIKKIHTRYLGDFLIEASQDTSWAQKMHDLTLEDKLNTSEAGFPEVFSGLFPEASYYQLEYSIERVNLTDIPRDAAAWWPVEPGTSYFMAYPTQFPQVAIYMAIDFDCGHDH